jgi:predicted O-methyltransferase YrrM
MPDIPWRKSCGLALPTVERAWLKKAASIISKYFKTPLIVNIGVFRCASMYCLRAGAPAARIIGIDVAACPIPIDPTLKAEFIIEDSTTCHVQVEGPIHLLFIDGDHHYEVVKADIKNWTPKVAPGGIVVFHDYAPLPKDLVKNPFLVGVRKAVSEWQAEVKWKRIPAEGSLAAYGKPKE